MSIAMDDALTRIRAHKQVISCGILTSRGELLTSAGDFDAADASRCARAFAVATSAASGGDDAGGDDDDDDVELVRVRVRGRELILTRSSNAIIAVVAGVER